MPDYMVFFGNNLSQEEYNSDERREEIYSAGLQAIEKIEGARVVTPLPASAIALIRISDDAIDRFKQVLESLDPPAAYERETYEPIMRPASSELE